jgi:hypothetical protein
MERLKITLMMAATVGLSSCTKDKSGVDMFGLAAVYGQTVTVPSSDYVADIAVELERSEADSPYTAGLIEYSVDDALIVSLSFDEGDDFEALVEHDSGQEMVSLGGTDECSDSKDPKAYSMVVLEPLVMAEDCGYVVAGEIGFFSCSTGKWAASLDYGDGSCDALITKSTPDGDDYIFSMDDYPEWNK